MDDDLERCPFCGWPGKAERKMERYPYATNMLQAEQVQVKYRIICSNPFCFCRPSSPWCDTEEEAKYFWNQRDPW